MKFSTVASSSFYIRPVSTDLFCNADGAERAISSLRISPTYHYVHRLVARLITIELDLRKRARLRGFVIQETVFLIDWKSIQRLLNQATRDVIAYSATIIAQLVGYYYVPSRIIVCAYIGLKCRNLRLLYWRNILRRKWPWDMRRTVANVSLQQTSPSSSLRNTSLLFVRSLCEIITTTCDIMLSANAC